MKQIKLLIVAFGLSLGLYAQDNDTALLRQNGVQELNKYVIVHAFTRKADTCLFFSQTLDSLSRVLYERSDMNCYGFQQIEEYDYMYGDKGLKGREVTRPDGPFTSTSYSFNDKDQPIMINTFNYRTNDSTVSTYEYFQGKYTQPDSSILTTIDIKGDTSRIKTIARFNKLGLPVTIISMDESRTVTEDLTYEYKDSLVMSMAHTSYGDRPGFTQTFYEYDQNDRMVISYNTVNQRQEYFYFENGLMSNIFMYNPKGELEAEYLFKYKYK